MAYEDQMLDPFVNDGEEEETPETNEGISTEEGDDEFSDADL